MSATAALWPAGAAYVDGRFMPVAEAMIPVTDWGYDAQTGEFKDLVKAGIVDPT